MYLHHLPVCYFICFLLSKLYYPVDGFDSEKSMFTLNVKLMSLLSQYFTFKRFVRCEKVYERRMRCLFKFVDSVYIGYRIHRRNLAACPTRISNEDIVLILNLTSRTLLSIVRGAALPRHRLVGSKQLMDYFITGHLNEKVH